jgi:hypothetical protein
MTTIQESPRVLDTQILEHRLSAPWKALIVVISAVAAAAIGFSLAGLAGLSLAATLGTGLGFSAIHLISCSKPEQTPDETQELRQKAVERAIETIGNKPKDPEIKWVTGTRSPTLALMLAVHREKLMDDRLMGHPALVIPHLLNDLGISPLERNHLSPFQKKNINYAVDPALKDQAPFNLQKELEMAYKLPGDDLGNNRINIEYCLETLRFTIHRLLQYGMYPQKEKLKEHLQTKLIPVFDTAETFCNQMALFPEHQAFVQANRREGKPCLEELEQYRTNARRLLDLFNQIHPIRFNGVEQDLIDHPCPLVFASKTVKAYPLDETEWVGRPGQLIVPKEFFRFGEDLQCVYTTTPDIERIKRVLEPYGVEVRDLESL